MRGWIAPFALMAPNVAMSGLPKASPVREALEHEVSELRKALEFIATHFSSEWPERCQSNVLTARKALTHGMGHNVRAERPQTAAPQPE